MAKAARFKQSRLQRAKAKRSERTRAIIICEGKNSEPLYFAALKQRSTKAITLYGAAGTPDAIARSAIERKKEVVRVGGWCSGKDQIWAVFDRDDHEHLDEAVVTCRDNGISVARSNPCFEVWLVLHYEADYHKPEHRADVFKRLCTHLPSYKEGKGRNCDFRALLEMVDQAEARAKAQCEAREREGAAHGAPSTTVHELTLWLRSDDEQ